MTRRMLAVGLVAAGVLSAQAGPVAALDPAVAAELKVDIETVDCPSLEPEPGQKELTLAGLAARVVKGPGPAVVLFVSRSTPGDRDVGRRNRAFYSQLALNLFTDIDKNLETCIAGKCFRKVYRVDVTGLDSGLINDRVGPVMALFNGKGEVVKILGPGNIWTDGKGEVVKTYPGPGYWIYYGCGCTPTHDIQKAMAEALGPEVIAGERGILQDIQKLSGDKARRDAIRKDMETAQGEEAGRIKREIEALEAEIQGIETSIRERKARLFPLSG